MSLTRPLAHALDDLLTRAFAEDGEDITSLAVFGPSAHVSARLICREQAVVAGVSFGLLAVATLLSLALIRLSA